MRFEAEGDPDRAALCRCSDCRELTGSAFRIVLPVASDGLRFTRGKPKIFIKTAERGAKREQAFCGKCGSPIFGARFLFLPRYPTPRRIRFAWKRSNVGQGPKTLGLRVGTLRQRRDLAPRSQIWQGSALPWVSDLFDALATAAGEPGKKWGGVA